MKGGGRMRNKGDSEDKLETEGRGKDKSRVSAPLTSLFPLINEKKEYNCESKTRLRKNCPHKPRNVKN